MFWTKNYDCKLFPICWYWYLTNWAWDKLLWCAYRFTTNPMKNFVLVRMSDNISLLKRKIQNFTSYQIVPIFPFQFPPSFPLLAQIELSLQWPMSHSSGNGKLAATLLCRWSTVMVPSQHSHSINTANREEASAPKSNTLLRPLALRDTTPVWSSLCWI